jgi:Mrp family chromosome partitioning ATPase
VTVNITANLDIIKSGILPVAENNYLSSTDEFRNLLDSLRDQYDYILVDSPPILKVSDAGILGHAVEQVLLVVRAEATPSTLVSSAQELLTAQGCAASACILVNHHHQMDVYSYITNNHYRNYYSNFYKSYDNRQPNSSSN